MLGSLFAMALAVNLDGFGVGLTYGLRKAKISALSILFITLCSACMILISMKFGSWLSMLFTPNKAKLVGALILIGVGTWAIGNLARKNRNSSDLPAVRNNSGNIAFSETAFLALALSCDSFGAGIGAALIGLPPVATSLVCAFFNFFFILFGTWIGFFCSKVRCLKQLSYLPGILLILFGISKIM